MQRETRISRFWYMYDFIITTLAGSILGVAGFKCMYVYHIIPCIVFSKLLNNLQILIKTDASLREELYAKNSFISLNFLVLTFFICLILGTTCILENCILIIPITLFIFMINISIIHFYEFIRNFYLSIERSNSVNNNNIQYIRQYDPQLVIEHLQRYVINTNEEPYNSCPICIEDIMSDCIKLPCSHYYHKECIQNWFLISRHLTCPTCRTELILSHSIELDLIIQH